jgi:bifunctional diaminopimelate decarboxylase / aspartate kinase
MITASSFVVLKFGGTSVSTAQNWRNIARVLRERLAEGLVPVVVHSALSGVTDRLEQLIEAALSGQHLPILSELEARHAALAESLGISLPPALARRFEELHQLAAGVALVGEASERIRAQVMSTGEFLATELGAAFLAREGLPVEWLDARTLLTASARRGASARAAILSAACDYAPDPALAARLARPGTLFLTQGFIAADRDGHTVLLGRGGSDTSGAYLASKLSAVRLEIWTDVPGLFSANPRTVKTARLLKALHYDEAQEIASSGAKVLHPRCVAPVKQHGIPLYVYATQTPAHAGTLISADAGGATRAQVKAIALKKGVTLVSMNSPGMWHQIGFLADVFAVFANLGLSVDLVSTSETNVTVSLDPAANGLEPAALEALIESLSAFCKAELIGPCASVSVVGRNIRGLLHGLGGALALFKEERIYLVSQAANDLNLTLCIDEAQGDRLVGELHELLIRPGREDTSFGPSWTELHGASASRPTPTPPWWRRERARLLERFGARDAAYVYDLDTVGARARALRVELPSIERVHYAMKANPHPALLARIAAEGLSFECVSRAEVEHALAVLPNLAPAEILFTPNFAPRAEYAWALERGVKLTLDNLHPLREWPALFAGRELFVRIDTGQGHGHHAHVRTAGEHSKFGVPRFELEELARLAGAAGVRIRGLHAHLGSGIAGVSTWAQAGERLAEAAALLPEVEVLDLGGGLPVPERAASEDFDLAALEHSLASLRSRHGRLRFWLEPGRYLVAESGVLLARVTQLKGKGALRYVGVATGMNSLIRPALYGAYHEIVNLTRLDERASVSYNVVGPICESGDVLGHDRLLPPTHEGDVLLVATAGAYGHTMGSHYNLRPPAEELLLQSR